MHIACIVGARPNFMKVAPILRAMETRPEIRTTLIHTGQHYDASLSDVFFDELGIRKPDISLGVGSGSHAKQTADVMVAIEQVILEQINAGTPFTRMLVVGDVNSTAAATIAAAKLLLPVAHVEAGLRSFDRTMPEEINRLLTDSVSDLLLVSEPAGVENLKHEGHADDSIHLVGNVMIDTLLQQLDNARSQNTLDRLNLTAGNFGVVTLHRPSNVDHQDVLTGLIDVLVEVAIKMPLAFPIHPRTQMRLKEFGLHEVVEKNPNIQCLGPLGYLDFLCLTSQAKVIVTDSGGLHAGKYRTTDYLHRGDEYVDRQFS
jgi:UDP-N-acetylglucosamine 2-epimerase (non-hydrolysing)